MTPEPRIVGYSKTDVFGAGPFEGRVGYLLWEITSYVVPEYYGVHCGPAHDPYFPERIIPTKHYKTPITNFLRIMLK